MSEACGCVFSGLIRDHCNEWSNLYLRMIGDIGRARDPKADRLLTRPRYLRLTWAALFMHAEAVREREVAS